MLVLAAGAAAWFVLSGGDDDVPAVPSSAESGAVDPVPAPAQVGEDGAAASSSAAGSSDSIGQIGADAISGTEDLVEIINERDQETELLAELGLDATGEPLTDLALGAGPAAGHTFRWIGQNGSTATITVVALTGDHSVSTDDGIEFRSIGGLAFARTADSEAWAEIAAGEIESIDRLGLAAPLTLSELLGRAGAHATSTPGQSAIDDDAFAAAGARVLVCARRGDRLAALAEELRAAHGVEVHHFTLDVRSRDAVEEAFAALRQRAMDARTTMGRVAQNMITEQL